MRGKHVLLLPGLGLALSLTVGLATAAWATPDLSPDGKTCTPCHDAPAASATPAPAQTVPAPAPVATPVAASAPAPALALQPVHGQAVKSPVWPAKSGKPAVVLSTGEVTAKVGALMVNGHAMVALKDVAAFLGVEVKEDSWWKDASLALPMRSLSLMTAAPWASLNGTPVPVKYQNVERDGLLFVPVTTVAKLLDARVSWNAKTLTARIDL